MRARLLIRTSAAVIAVALALCGATASAQITTPASPTSANPRYGAWKLKPETPPAAGNLSSNIMTYEPHMGAGMKVTIDTTNAAGAKGTSWGYVTMLDGKDLPVTGRNGTDTASVLPLNDKINLIIYRKGDRLVQVLLNTLSADNNTLNISYTSTNAQGETRTTYAVYERIVK